MTERMGVLSSDGRCLQPSPLAARAMLRPAARRLAAVGIGFAGGWAVLYGALMPFGLGLTLGLAEDCFAPCAAGAALGLLLHGLGALSLRSLCQLCALGAAVAARWLLPQKFMPAALAGCSTLTGMALCFALGSSGGADLLLYSAADALLAAAIGFGLRKFAPERPGMGTLLVGAAVAAALGSVRWGWFSPGILACAAAELALCCRAQKFAALSGSAVLGAALCAADPALAPAAAGLGCATAAAVVLAPGRRVETLAAYAGGCVSGVLCVQPPGNAFGLLFSACGGMAVVCLLPGGWLAPAADTPQSGENTPAPARSAAASTRLEAVAQSLSSLAETVNAVYEGLPRRREGFRWVIDNVHDTLCFNCGRRETCWKQEYTATMAGMEALRPLLEQNGSVEAAQLPGELSRCIHPAALCAAAGRSFALYRSRKEARIHSEAMRTALTEQYSAVAEALGVLSEQLGRPGDPEPYKSSRVAEFFTGLGAPPQECAVTLDDLGRTHAAVTLPRTRFTPQELAALAGEVGHICRRTLEVPQVLSCKGMTTLLFSERPALRAVFGAAGERGAGPEKRGRERRNAGPHQRGLIHRHGAAVQGRSRPGVSGARRAGAGCGRSHPAHGGAGRDERTEPGGAPDRRGLRGAGIGRLAGGRCGLGGKAGGAFGGGRRRAGKAGRNAGADRPHPRTKDRPPGRYHRRRAPAGKERVTAAEFPLQFAGRRGILEAYFSARQCRAQEAAYAYHQRCT